MRIPFKFIKMFPTTGKNKQIKVLNKGFNVNKTTANRHLLGLFIVLMGYQLFVTNAYLTAFTKKKKRTVYLENVHRFNH